MRMIGVVSLIAGPVIAGFSPGNAPKKTMAERGFVLFSITRALQLISARLADPRETADGRPYEFEFDLEFAHRALALDLPGLGAAIAADVETAKPYSLAYAGARFNPLRAATPERSPRSKKRRLTKR
jgi:hypothetical protein